MTYCSNTYFFIQIRFNFWMNSYCSFKSVCLRETVDSSICSLTSVFRCWILRGILFVVPKVRYISWFENRRVWIFQVPKNLAIRFPIFRKNCICFLCSRVIFLPLFTLMLFIIHLTTRTIRSRLIRTIYFSAQYDRHP